jgi:NAD+ synthase (glutamine-hydrolysing)
MKIRICQLKPKLNDLEFNFFKIASEVKIAALENCKIICFPESILTGYPMEDKLYSSSLTKDIEYFINKIILLTLEFKNLYVLIGTPFEKSNLIFIIKNGKIVKQAIKNDLPNYGVFDEKRYFKPGNKPCVIKIEGLKILLPICEDIWSLEYISKAVQLKPDLIICANASPFEREKFEERLLRARAFKNIPFIYVNQVLAVDEIIFDGRSFVLNKRGKITHAFKAFTEESMTLDLNKDQIFINTYKPLELLYKGLVFGLQEYLKAHNFKGVLLGLSGGIDSALVAKIALDALDANKVQCYFLPSKISSSESRNDALNFCKLNNLILKEIDISESRQVISETVFGNKKPLELTDENLQARIRGLILMTLSNESGNMLLTTGNKSELAIGYCTLYGDMNGGFNPIKDLYKTEVFELCHFLNKRSDIFPSNILNKKPTAELKINQTDESSIGMPYASLDFILLNLIENSLSFGKIASLMQKNNLYKKVEKFRKDNSLSKANAEDLVKRVLHLLKSAEYKRYQSAPGTKISKRAFGRDWRYGLSGI